MNAPLTPRNCDLRDFPRMMLDIPRLRGSDFDATLDDGAWRAGLNLWMSAWHQMPAASLSSDDASLAKAAGLGRDIRSWKKVKAAALRGWTLCSDGNLYHAVIAELALEAWIDKLGQRLSSGAGNAKRYDTKFDHLPLYAEIRTAAVMLSALNAKSRSLSKQHVQKALKDVPAGVPPEVPVGGEDTPSGRPVRSQGNGIDLNGSVAAVVGASDHSDDWPDGKATDHAKALEALNPRIDPTRKQGLITSIGEIARWRRHSFSWALDVIPIVTAHAARDRADDVGTWTYFSKAIAQAHANRTRPADIIDMEPRREPPRQSRREAEHLGRLSDIDRAMAEACE